MLFLGKSIFVFGSFCLGDCNRGHFGGLPCFCDSYTNGDNCTESKHEGVDRFYG